jgi:uncharacterized membrane protein
MAVVRRLRGIGTFPNRDKAEEALHELRESGFPMDRVSILAKDTDRDDEIRGSEVDEAQNRGSNRKPGKNESPEGAGIGAVAGTVLGGLGGLLVGLEAILIPGVGPFLAAGTVATTLAGAGIGAAAGSLVGALTGLGIPEEQAQVYNERVQRGDYLVIIEGTEDEINRAASVVRKHNISDWAVYEIPGGDVDYQREEVRPVEAQPVVVDRTPERYEDRNIINREDRTTTEHGVVEIIDKRNDVC